MLTHEQISSEECSTFRVMITGHIESACYQSRYDNLYCRYALTYGPDWNVIHGIDSGISQISRKNTAYSGSELDEIIWNFPIDIAFKSTNVFGWPRLSVAAYGLDALGRDVIRGYGCVLIPIFPGRYVKYIDTYTPVSKNLCQRFLNWIFGTPCEFFDLKMTASNDGRALVKIRSEGCIKVIFNVIAKDMEILHLAERRTIKQDK